MFITPRRNRNRDDAADEKRPNDRMRRFNCPQTASFACRAHLIVPTHLARRAAIAPGSLKPIGSMLRTTEDALEGSTRRTALIPVQEIPGIVPGVSLLAYSPPCKNYTQS